MKTFFLWILSVTASAQSIDHSLDYFTNLHGVYSFKKENYTGAYTDFLEVLNHQSTSPEMLMNVGRVYEELKQYDQALKAYQGALKFADKADQKFYAHFNIGNVYAAKKQIDEALKSYQAALDIKPNSREVKHNIELLIQGGQGQGQGEGEQDQKQDDPNQKNKDQQGQQPKDQGQDRKSSQQYKMKPFKSDNLNEQDVNKIFDELKQQENNIRDNMNKQENPKESSGGKDW